MRVEDKIYFKRNDSRLLNPGNRKRQKPAAQLTSVESIKECKNIMPEKMMFGARMIYPYKEFICVSLLNAPVCLSARPLSFLQFARSVFLYLSTSL